MMTRTTKIIGLFLIVAMVAVVPYWINDSAVASETVKAKKSKGMMEKHHMMKEHPMMEKHSMMMGEKCDKEMHEKMATKCKKMHEKKEKMMAMMKEMDNELKEELQEMNRAPADKKVQEMAELLNEMVDQRLTMHKNKMKMHQGMMKHMMEHMKLGCKNSMMECPMMKENTSTKKGEKKR